MKSAPGAERRGAHRQAAVDVRRPEGRRVAGVSSSRDRAAASIRGVPLAQALSIYRWRKRRACQCVLHLASSSNAGWVAPLLSGI